MKFFFNHFRQHGSVKWTIIAAVVESLHTSLLPSWIKIFGWNALIGARHSSRPGKKPGKKLFSSSFLAFKSAWKKVRKKAFSSSFLAFKSAWKKAWKKAVLEQLFSLQVSLFARASQILRPVRSSGLFSSFVFRFSFSIKKQLPKRIAHSDHTRIGPLCHQFHKRLDHWTCKNWITAINLCFGEVIFVPGLIIHRHGANWWELLHFLQLNRPRKVSILPNVF